jgi:cytochrome c biogenesis factor
LPRSTWGAAFAHFGLGITLLGIIGETQWEPNGSPSSSPASRSRSGV